MKATTSQLDSLVRDSLCEFVSDVFATSWWGKEREAVSFYAFGYLSKFCKAGSILYDLAQIGIEVRVPKPESLGRKREVCKDLLIWPKPGMNCWNKERKAQNYPLAVLEWKVNQRDTSRHDLDWLLAFSANRPNSVGYAVCLDLYEREFRLRCTRVRNSRPNNKWLVIKP